VRDALAEMGPSLQREISAVADLLGRRRGKIVTTGIGKSGFIAQKVSATLSSLGTPSLFLHPTEALHGDLGVLGRGDSVIAFSHSGGTHELIEALRHVTQRRIPVIAICSNADSPLSSMSAHTLVYPFYGEGSPHDLAPMASTTLSLIVGDMLVSEISMRRGFSPEIFANLHPSGTLGLQLVNVQKIMRKGRLLPLVDERASFLKGVAVMDKGGLGLVGVINDQKLLRGILTDGDVRRMLLRGGGGRISDAMTRRPKTIDPGATLLEALRRMEEYKITSLFVVDSPGRPVGILHMHQIIERHLP